MAKKLKRLVCTVLAIVMCLSEMSTAAFAAETETGTAAKSAELLDR